MAKVITQETFDEVVKENIVEFSMTVDEAKVETIEQFEAQGINLGNIIKDLNLNAETGEPIIVECIQKLEKHSKEEERLKDEHLIECLNALTKECEKTVPHRVLAAKNGALDVILNNLDKEIPVQKSLNVEIVHKHLQTAITITNKQPDIFNDKCLSICIRLINTQQESDIHCAALKFIEKACYMHEINRQNIMNADILSFLKPLLKSDDANVVRQTCAVLRYLIMDDDIRVEFGKAHEHARTIATESLSDLTKLLTKFKDHQDLVCDLILTIASLTVRNEFCQVVEEAGGLKFTLDAMVDYPDSMKLCREAFKLLKALAGNDTVKVNIITQGAAPLIESSLNRFKANENFAKTALACISLLTLRVKSNSEAMFETGISETIIETMKIHDKSKDVQRNGAWTIRNMVARCKEQCDTFIAHGAEDILNAGMAAHPTVANDLKAALRDLGCKVNLKEEWKGKSEIQITKEF